MLALSEALRDGYDEVLLLDVDGFVAEGSGENIFIVQGGVIYTPELTSVLEGITRDTVITIAQDEGFEVVEKRIQETKSILLMKLFHRFGRGGNPNTGAGWQGNWERHPRAGNRKAAR